MFPVSFQISGSRKCRTNKIIPGFHKTLPFRPCYCQIPFSYSFFITSAGFSLVTFQTLIVTVMITIVNAEKISISEVINQKRCRISIQVNKSSNRAKNKNDIKLF